jgi:hypothetical protein
VGVQRASAKNRRGVPLWGIGVGGSAVKMSLCLTGDVAHRVSCRQERRVDAGSGARSIARGRRGAAGGVGRRRGGSQQRTLTGFPSRPSLPSMTWTNDEELQLSIRRGIREGFDLVRGTRGSLSEDQERVIADAVVKHLEKGDWRSERGPPSEGHGGTMPK